MLWLHCLVSSLMVANVLAGGGYGNYRNVEYDCGGTCGGGASAPVVISDGCGSGACEGGYDDGSYSHSRQSSGYHRSESSIVKETNTKHLKITIGAPLVHKISRIISQPAPIYHHPRPHRVHKQSYTDCDYGCGGGSKIVKVIKKTTYKTVPAYTEECTTCGGAEYVEQPVVVRKVTKIIKRPKVVKVVKVIDEGHGGYGGHGYGDGGGGYESSRSGAYAYSSSSARSGGYGGGGCKVGCEEWRK